MPVAMRGWDPLQEPATAGPSRRERLLLAGVFLLYVAIVATTAGHHEPWRDEADSWLMARDASPAHLWSFFRHSGHPGLWGLLLAPLARGGAPYGAMSALNALIAAAGIAVFLRRAPFPLALKVLFPFGVVPLFEYGVIARNYALAFSLLMVALALLSGARKRPVATGVSLALLANAHALSLGIAATLTAYWAVFDLRPDLLRRETRARLHAAAALATAGAGILLSIVQLLPPGDPWPRRIPDVATGFLYPFAASFFPVALGGSNARPGGSLAASAAALLLGALVLVFLRSNRGVLAWYALSIAGMSCFFLLKHAPFFRHASFFLLITLAALWLAQARDGAVKRTDPLRSALWVMLGLSFVVSAAVGLRRAAADVRWPFSGSREAAALLDRVDPARSPVVLYRQTCGEAIVPYLEGRLVWYPEQGAFGTYLPWTPPRKFPDSLAAYRVAERTLAGTAPPVLVTCRKINNPGGAGLRLVATTIRPYREFAEDERYYLYRKIAP